MDISAEQISELPFKGATATILASRGDRVPPLLFTWATAVVLPLSMRMQAAMLDRSLRKAFIARNQL